MTHPVLSLYPFLHAIGHVAGSDWDQAGLLASIERDDDKELRLETSTALLAAGIAANTTLRTLEVKCDSRQDWPADLWLALAEGVKRNLTLESFTVDTQSRGVGDEVVAALAGPPRTTPRS